MSETSSLRGKTALIEAQNDNGRSSGIVSEGPSKHLEEAAPPGWITASLEEDNEQSVPPRDLLNSAPDVTHPVRKRRKTKHRSFFGLTHEIGLNYRDAYEQKYARDRYGEETSENARIWLTYLDEAEPFDRERVEEWKGAADVLLVFAGLFSSVITTFIVQASQSLQQDNTQVSASLLFEIAGILRAQSNGTPLNMIQNSTLTLTSPFTPSTNALLVNGLWFTSLAITLSTALFAVIAKQWSRYSLASIPGTAKERARVRQLRLKGFEVWKVGTILDLLPVLLYLAVGLFLAGIIIMLFPLNATIAWMIVGITGITYTLYFISVILPIRYLECPYTTSMTIYVGVLFFALRNILNWSLQGVWRKINPEASVIRRLRGNLTGFTTWREEKIKQAVQSATFLDFEALRWLYGISWNRSVHRMIARCAAVNPIISTQFGYDILRDLSRSLEISDSNVMDLRYGLYLDLLTNERGHWRLLRSIPDAQENHLEEEEFQAYLGIADTVLRHHDKLQILHDAIKGNCKLPPTMWGYLLRKAEPHHTVAVHRDILIHKTSSLSDWAFYLTRQHIPDTGPVRFDSEELGSWKFECLFGHLEAKTYETCYNLLIIIYRSLTSDDPLDIGKGRKQVFLYHVFHSFHDCLISSGRLRPLEDSLRLAYALRFFTEICCVDSFWCVSMTDKARENAILALRAMVPRPLADTQLDNHLLFTVSHDLSLIYQWYSRDLDWDLSYRTPPLFLLLLVSQNRHHLSTILLTDTNAVSNFSKCVQNLANCYIRYTEKEMRIYQILMDLLKSVDPKKNPRLFTVLYNRSVLLQLWALLVFYDHGTEDYFLLLKSKIARDKLDELYAAMNELAQSDYLNLPIAFQQGNYMAGNARLALATSARQFGELIGVSHIQPEAASDQSAPGNAPSINDHNNEERAQVSDPSEHRTFKFIGNWMKKVLESIRLKIPRSTSDQPTAGSIPLGEMGPTSTA